MGSGESQKQDLMVKEEKYHAGGQLSSLKANVKPSLHGAEERTGLLRAPPNHCFSPPYII